MSKCSAAPLLPNKEGGLTSGPPSDSLPGLGARLERIEGMVKAILEAFVGQGAHIRPGEGSNLLPFNEAEYNKAMSEARGGNFKAIQTYLRKYEGRKET